MSNKNSKLHQATSLAVIDDAAATVSYTFDVPTDGYFLIDESYAVAEEATGTQTSAQGVIAIEVGGVEVATLTADQSQSIGHTQTFTPDGTNATAANPVYKFSAGDAIEVVIKTQASGGTTTGQYRAFLAFDFS